jgi:hypothetical protein
MVVDRSLAADIDDKWSLQLAENVARQHGQLGT